MKANPSEDYSWCRSWFLVKEKREGQGGEGHQVKRQRIQVKQWEQVGDGGTGAKEMAAHSEGK